jgi:hypothetical protein
MARVPVANVGAVGVVKDLAPHELPPEAWSDAHNVRFYDGKGVKFLGHTQVFGTPGTAPRFALEVPTAAANLWLYLGLTAAYAYNGSTHSDVTNIGGAYSASASLPWTGGLLGGVPVIAQPADPPQMWNPATAATQLVDLTNWPAATFARIIKPFPPYLVALNITKAAGTFLHMIKWSHPADPGTVPSSWDETDPTVDAGETELADTHAGMLLDELTLGTLNILYKESSTWGMQHIGGRNIFRFYPISGESGILATHCVSLLGDGRHHFCATGSDVIVHDGQNLTSVADRRWRRWLSNNIDTTNFVNSFTVMNLSRREAWFCFPEIGATLPTLAFTWNWGDASTGIRELKDVAFISSGIVRETLSTDTWDGGPANTWKDDAVIWGDRSFNPHELSLLMCDPVASKFFQADTTEQLDGVNMKSYVERSGLAIAGVDRQGNPKVDPSIDKLCTEIWPRVTGGPVFVRVGSQKTPLDEITWQTPQLFDPLTQEKVDVCVEGKYIGVRFESEGATPWELHGYDMEIEPLGRY